MNTVFMSAFAERLNGFLEQKRALGYSFSNISDFIIFDRLCVEQFPNETELTTDICNAWVTCRKNVSARTIDRSLPFIREFARYLIRNGEKAYILPNGIVKVGQKYIPHIFSTAQLSQLWKLIDDIQPTKTYPVADIVMSTLFRLLYCCGIRPSEAFNLRTEDINLDVGKLFIRESKGNKDRIVMLSDEARKMCCNYDESICKHFVQRNYFFPKNADEMFDYRWLNWTFRNIREKLNIETVNGKPPRLYDLRHTFATHRLYQWMREGKELYALLPYLSTYMGHSNLTETFYYIHLVPGMLESMSGFEYKSPKDIFPKVVNVDE